MNKADALQMVDEYEDALSEILSVANDENLSPEEAIGQIVAIAEGAIGENSEVTEPEED